MLRDLGSTGKITCRVPRAPFPIGQYHIGLVLDADNACADAVPNLLAFEVQTSVFFPEPRTPNINVCAAMVDHEWTHATGGNVTGGITAGAGNGADRRANKESGKEVMAQ
jgi:hypothetical protein